MRTSVQKAMNTENLSSWTFEKSDEQIREEACYLATLTAGTKVELVRYGLHDSTKQLLKVIVARSGKRIFSVDPEDEFADSYTVSTVAEGKWRIK